VAADVDYQEVGCDLDITTRQLKYHFISGAKNSSSRITKRSTFCLPRMETVCYNNSSSEKPEGLKCQCDHYNSQPTHISLLKMQYV